LKAKDICPECSRGRLYAEPPRTVIVLKGNPPVSAERHILERLRCNLCGSVFTASPNIGVKIDKRSKYYDPSVSVIIALLKNYMGMPFKRLESFQGMLDVPLKDATQWDLEEQFADKIHPVFTHLKWLAGQGEIVHSDDTDVKILSLTKENKTLEDKERRGMFTTGILSEYQGYKICLYLSGRNHCGENMAEIMSKRDPNLAPVIRMSDAISRNFKKISKDEAIAGHICKCLSHGRRKFVDVLEQFSKKVHPILRALGFVFHIDAITKREKMSNQERLAYHQENSASIMADIKGWIERQLLNKRVETSGSLGKAMAYMLSHWEGLTQFLRIPGAPLDNNILERILKTIIRVRKNSLFYKTEHGAYVGGMLTSLIQTCHMNGINPIHYLMSLTRNSTDLFKSPQDWLPWNYQKTMEKQNLKLHPPENILEPSSLVA
jgi:transposase